MIKKSIDKIRATNTQKKDIYERICADYEKNKKEEKKAGNKFLKYGTMAAAIVLVLGAVAVVVSIVVNMQGVPVTHPESGGTSQSDTEGNLSSSPQSNSSIGCNSMPPPQIDVAVKPIIMTWEDIDENSEVFEIFKKTYGVPENKPSGYEDTPDENILCYVKKVNYSDRYVDLAKMVVSDDAPDIFPYDTIAFPYAVYKNLFQSVDNVIDFSNPCWETHNSHIDNFRWQGKTYTPILSIEATQYLWYRKSVIEDYGFTDPYTLYKQGDWDYDAFFSMVSEFTDSKKEKYGIDGYPYIIDSFIATTGKTFFTIENGKLVSNLYDSDIINTVDMLSSRLNDIENKYNSDDQLRYPNEGLNNWNPSYKSWVDGNTLFFADGQWIYDGQWIKYKELKEWNDDEIQFVPFPKYDKAESYYFDARINSYMLCSGSKNIEGYAAFMHSVAAAEYGRKPESSAGVELKQTNGWTSEMLARLSETTDITFNIPVFSAKDSIEKATTPAVGCYDPVISDLTRMPFRGEKSFTEVRDEYPEFIAAWVEELNS